MQNNFVDDPTCAGNVGSGNTCIFSNKYLIDTYGFTVGTIVRAKVRARNLNGWGAFS